ncbi:hypothetical protein BDI4_340007 [Burkholderia diffusa]|nr:hypothetical protein BDI4_340007 [Burkholderia diffusa]
MMRQMFLKTAAISGVSLSGADLTHRTGKRYHSRAGRGLAPPCLAASDPGPG